MVTDFQTLKSHKSMSIHDMQTTKRRHGCPRDRHQACKRKRGRGGHSAHMRVKGQWERNQRDDAKSRQTEHERGRLRVLGVLARVLSATARVPNVLLTDGLRKSFIQRRPAARPRVQNRRIQNITTWRSREGLPHVLPEGIQCMVPIQSRSIQDACQSM